MNFSRIAIGIKTFLRDSKLFATVRSIQENMPGAQMIIADDGEYTSEKMGFYVSLKRQGHIIQRLSFDVGVGVKNNVMVESLDREYFLMGCDDFEFTSEAAAGVLRLQEVLDSNPQLSIASGEVSNRPYEFFLTDENGIVREHPLDYDINGRGQAFVECDLTINYYLARRNVFEKIRWDYEAEDVKIGGGLHGAFFVDVKRAGLKVAFVPGVSISEQSGLDSPVYRKYRSRTRIKSRSCFDRRGIREYWLGDGRLDYRKIPNE